MAAFLAKKEPWVLDAQCAGHADLFLAEPQTKALLAEERDVCSVCPVRVECGERALEEEGTLDLSNRFYTRAYMTPPQRLSIQRRGGLKGRDPMKLVLGDDNGRRVPPIPDEGDKWSKHHTTLARKLVRWLAETCELGQRLPTNDLLQKHLECNPAPLQRVLDALVQDGTLDMSNGCLLYRGGHGVLGSTSWLPTHLREPQLSDLGGHA